MNSQLTILIPGKPLTRLMKPNQNVKSITSVVVILLSLPAIPQKKERKELDHTAQKERLHYIKRGERIDCRKAALFGQDPRVVILPYFVLAAIVAVVPFGIVSEVPGFLILLLVISSLEC
ncbi:hypothetical protein HN51_058898 [Arachis hypogaea]|uniref:Uncharacterized protein n=1 Tax=Arachis hypogaea TaxID=3818 RepID=A0A444X3C4_ARAHY|nr:hypothetical protein Ahy_B10g102997 [Arachis hypogaea]